MLALTVRKEKSARLEGVTELLRRRASKTEQEPTTKVKTLENTLQSEERPAFRVYMSGDGFHILRLLSQICDAKCHIAQVFRDC